jgi:hypothetical protein
MQKLTYISEVLTVAIIRVVVMEEAVSTSKMLVNFYMVQHGITSENIATLYEP